MMPAVVGAVVCGERHLCRDVRARLTKRQPMTIAYTSHVMCQANDGEGRSAGRYVRTLWCTSLDTQTGRTARSSWRRVSVDNDCALNAVRLGIV